MHDLNTLEPTDARMVTIGESIPIPITRLKVSRRLWRGYLGRRRLLEHPTLVPLSEARVPYVEQRDQALEVLDAVSARAGVPLTIACRAFLPVTKGKGDVAKRVDPSAWPAYSFIVHEDGKPVVEAASLGTILTEVAVRYGHPVLLVSRQPRRTNWPHIAESEGPTINVHVLVGRLRSDSFVTSDLWESGITVLETSNVDWYATFAPGGRDRLLTLIGDELRSTPPGLFQHRMEELEPLLTQHGVRWAEVSLSLLAYQRPQDAS